MSDNTDKHPPSFCLTNNLKLKEIQFIERKAANDHLKPENLKMVTNNIDDQNCWFLFCTCHCIIPLAGLVCLSDGLSVFPSVSQVPTMTRVCCPGLCRSSLTALKVVCTAGLIWSLSAAETSADWLQTSRQQRATARRTCWGCSKRSDKHAENTNHLHSVRM